jgi:hypothetical protein
LANDGERGKLHIRDACPSYFPVVGHIDGVTSCWLGNLNGFSCCKKSTDESESKMHFEDEYEIEIDGILGQ